MTHEKLKQLMNTPKWKRFKSFHEYMTKSLGSNWLGLYKKKLSKEKYDAYYSATQVVETAVEAKKNSDFMSRQVWADYCRDFSDAHSRG